MEASGKSTLLAGLAARLGEHDIAFVLTREPGGTPLGAALRATFLDPSLRIGPLAEALILSASRAQLLAEVIEPALAEGRHVLCDRFTDSTLVYQGYGRGLELEMLDALAGIATRGRTPDLTLFVDVPVEESRRRVQARAAERGEPIDRVEREGDDFHERARQGYLQLARRSQRFVTLDGTLQPEPLLDRAWAVVKRELT